MKHDQSSYFCRVPDDFCWGPAPMGPALVTGPDLSATLDTNDHSILLDRISHSFGVIQTWLCHGFSVT